MRVTPMYDLVICERVEVGEKVGSIYVPEQSREKTQEGTVLDVGFGRLLQDGTLLPLRVKPGDHVLFGKFAGSEIKVNGDKRLLLREGDILAILEPDNDSSWDVTE